MARFLPRNIRSAWGRLASGAGADNVKNLLALAGNPHYFAYWDDFVGQSAGTWPASANWGYPATAGTGTEVIGIGATSFGGTLTLTTGASANDGAFQAVGRHWRGTEGIYACWRVQLDAITTAKFEVGLTDSITAEQAINAKATPTFTATDCACFVFDTNDDTNITFVTAAAGVAGANADSSFALVAATYVDFEIVVRGGFASGYLNGQLVGGGAVTAATLYTPYAETRTRTTATRTLTVDYMGCVGPRFA